MEFYSNGKLLLTSEYLVLDGAIALAIPTKYGQDLMVETMSNNTENQLHWQSIDQNNTIWFSCVFQLPSLKIITSPSHSISKVLQKTLKLAQKENSDFLRIKKSIRVSTSLDFPRNWGLGSSSTLINNIANWAKIDAYKLQFNIFGGSAYDIACAKNNSAILYRLDNSKPQIETVIFDPPFKDKLFFIHLNQKQNSREAIAMYRDYKEDKASIIKRLTAITKQFYTETSFEEFKKLLIKHELLISSIIKIKPIKERLFKDYFGEIKSLGAWGGDFILATGTKKTKDYFEQKGYKTIIPFEQMVL